MNPVIKLIDAEGLGKKAAKKYAKKMNKPADDHPWRRAY